MGLTAIGWARAANLASAVILNLVPVVVGAQTVAPDKGFLLEPIPTTADPPGTVFRVDPSGVRFDVADLSRRLPHHVADVALPDFASSRKVKGGFFLRFLAPNAVDAAAASAGTVVFRIRGAKKEST